MADLEKPITTQEQLNTVIADRIQRERAKYADYDTLKANAEKYKDYDTLKTKADAYDADKKKWETDLAAATAKVAEQTKKITDYETDATKTKVANELGLPFALKDRLQGTTEEEIRKDAESLQKWVGSTGSKTTVLPLASNGETGGDKDAEYKALLNKIMHKED